jgi:hypothetical protein
MTLVQPGLSGAATFAVTLPLLYFPENPHQGARQTHDHAQKKQRQIGGCERREVHGCRLSWVQYRRRRSNRRRKQSGLDADNTEAVKIIRDRPTLIDRREHRPASQPGRYQPHT